MLDHDSALHRTTEGTEGHNTDVGSCLCGHICEWQAGNARAHMGCYAHSVSRVSVVNLMRPNERSWGDGDWATSHAGEPIGMTYQQRSWA